MAKRLRTIGDVQEYAAGLLYRSTHHATSQRHNVMALLGYVLAVADPGSIRVMTRLGEPTNVAWFEVKGERYCFTYDHASCQLWLRFRSLQGQVLARIDHNSRPIDVYSAIAAARIRARAA
jgi:hypothetical protein